MTSAATFFALMALVSNIGSAPTAIGGQQVAAGSTPRHVTCTEPGGPNAVQLTIDWNAATATEVSFANGRYQHRFPAAHITVTNGGATWWEGAWGHDASFLKEMGNGATAAHYVLQTYDFRTNTLKNYWSTSGITMTWPCASQTG